MELTYGIESTTHVKEEKSKAPITQVTKKARTPEGISFSTIKLAAPKDTRL